MPIISTMHFHYNNITITLTIPVESKLSTSNGSIKLTPLCIIDSTPYVLIAYLHTTFVWAGTIQR